MFAQKETVTVTTDADGDATGHSVPIRGRIFSVRYIKTDYEDTVDFAITLEDSGIGVWSEDNITGSTTRAPLQPAHNLAGVALNYNDESNEPVSVPVVVVDERVKIVISNGGNTKTGVFEITYG